MKNTKERAITDLNAPNGSRDIPFQSQESEQDGRSPFSWFLASFSLEYDVTDAILQYKEKIKVQYLRSLLFDLFQISQTQQTIFISFQIFLAMATKTRIISL